jgi:hypothetical protein
MVRTTSAKIKNPLQFRVFLSRDKSKPRIRYLVLRTDEGEFHVFQEVEAKAAAKACGARAGSEDTRVLWNDVWNRKMRKTK